MGAPFDGYAGTYDKALDQGLAVSGEDKQYFLRGRVEFLASCLARLGERPEAILDFGCGDGATTGVLQERFGAAEVVGVDISEALIDRARTTYRSLPRCRFVPHSQFASEAGRYSLVYCNGVFHHIQPDERAATLRLLRDCLRPGGILALWDNSPWSLAARYVMRRIPFDRDAVMFWPHMARRLVTSCGLSPLRTDYLFVFPHLLRKLRFLERPLSSLPLGAQFQLLARRPIAHL